MTGRLSSTYGSRSERPAGRRSLLRALRRSWRVARWVGLAPALVGLWACTSRTLEQPKVLPNSVYQNKFVESVNRDIDILFVIDNSSSMNQAQAALNANFPRFMDVLEDLPDGLPNVHIGVVSSDMGAGSNITACSGYGNEGVFQYSPKTPCTDSTLGQATYIVNDNGTPNYTGDISTVFSCIANLGITGCGFEQHLASMARGLGADTESGPAPSANQGFLRKDAYLAIVIIANEDDCSAQGWASSPIFTTGDTNRIDSPYGPVGSFRCNEFGHLCGGMAPSRNAPGGDVAATVNYQDCVSNEQSQFLTSVGYFVDKVKALKSDPDTQILVAGIVGVPRGNPNAPIPYTVHFKPPTTGAAEAPWPEMSPGCGMTSALFGDPPVRLKQFVQSFKNGLLYSICEDDYGPSMRQIAEKLSALIGPKCIAGQFADVDGDPDGNLTPDCTVTDQVPRQGGGTPIESLVHSCASNPTPPCWELQAPNAMNGCMPGTHFMSIERGGTNPPQNATIACALCIPGMNRQGGRDCPANPAERVDPRCPC